MALKETINLGWHYYKNYFRTSEGAEIDSEGAEIDLSNGERLKKDEGIEKIFKENNKNIEDTLYPLVDFKTKSATHHLSLFTTYPGLLIGTGYPHEIGAKGESKLGFFFDYTHGLPIIPGSSVKGALRSVFPEFKMDDKNNFILDELNTQKAMWIHKLIKNIDVAGFITTSIFLDNNDTLSDNEINNICKLTLEIFNGIKDHTQLKPKEKYYSIYERDIFFDAYIATAGRDKKIIGTDAITPHDADGLKNPTPLPLIKILPNVEISFQFKLYDSIVIPTLTKDFKRLLFQKILLTIGIGAKTNVGYGQFSEKPFNSNTKNEGNKKVDEVMDEDIEAEAGKEYEVKLLNENKGIIEFKIGKKNFSCNIGNEASKKQLYKYINQNITIKIITLFKDGNIQKLEIIKVPVEKNNNKRRF